MVHKMKKEFGTHHYRPLVEDLTIKQSPINGLGLFAVNDLKAGIYLGETHIWESNRWEYIRTPLGGFINHSDTPNCFKITFDQTKTWIGTIRDIEPNEEITWRYTLYEIK